MTNQIDEDKKNLRRAMTAIRKAIVQQQPNPPPNLSQLLLAEFPQDFWHGKKVSFFYPIGSEVNTIPLLSMLAEFGAMICLPAVVAVDRPLIFRSYQSGDELMTESFGTLAPTADKMEIIPDVMFVPLLAFDEKKFRLGYGGGFYDRTIAQLSATPPITIGLAWQGQKIEKVPTDKYDRPLDNILTEEKIYS